MTKKGSSDETHCFKAANIGVRWSWLKAEYVLVGQFRFVKFDMSIVGIAGKAGFQRVYLDASQFVWEQCLDEFGLYIPCISIVKAEPHGNVPDEVLERDGLKPVILVNRPL